MPSLKVIIYNLHRCSVAQHEEIDMCLRLMITLILSTSLIACTFSSDPREGGFLGGLHGICTGAYDNRVQKQQTELAHQREKNQDLKEKSRILEGEAKARELALASEQEHVKEMEKNISRLESDINEMHAISNKQKDEIATLQDMIKNHILQLKFLQAELKKLEDDNDNGIAIDDKRYQAIKKERDRLTKEYGTFLKNYHNLSDAKN